MTVVMHNGGFDLRVLSSESARLGVDHPVRRVLCTRRIAQRVLKGLSSFDLQTVARAVGISEPVQHRALADAVITARVYEALRSMCALASTPTDP
jgi:DNA polymerase-3 subunit epsilon